MSAAVCGNKRSFFEELPSIDSSSSPVSKKLRCSSPIGFYPFSTPCLIDRLFDLFPHMDKQLLERALQECGNDLDSAIKSLYDLRLGYAEEIIDFNVESDVNVNKGKLITSENVASSENVEAQESLPMNGTEWVELFVKEMMSASSVDDARARATRVFEAFEKSITARAGSDAMQSFFKENMTLKEQIEVMFRENSILKRAVAIQHERQKEYDELHQELQHLKQLATRYQEQLRTLEVNNYALTMHLKQAQQGSSIPGRFNPDVF